MAAIYDEMIVLADAIRIESLNEIMRGALGAKISGVSTRSSGDTRIATVHFHVAHRGDVAPSADRALAQEIVAKCGALEVVSDKQSIVADGVDTAVVSCNDAVISGDGNVWVTVWLDGGEYMAPTMVAVGTVQAGLNLKTAFAGEYLFEVKRMGASDYETGYVTVQATEV